MTTSGSMTAAVWLAPMIPKLPLLLAQRVERLLEAKPGRETEEHALCLCEAIVAYAACVRASVAAAVLPASERASLNQGIGEFRRAVERGGASIASFRDLLVAAGEAIERLEPGHPLGRAELTRPRTAWIARTQLVEALGDSVAVSETIRARAVDGGIAGVVDLWVELVEARREVEIDPDGDPWLGRLGDLIVDVLNSSLLGDASLVHFDPASDAGVGELRLLHGIESDTVETLANPDAHQPGVGWSFDERGVSSCGLLSYWLDEHEFEHVGVISKHGAVAEYRDYGSGVCSARADSRVAWDHLQVAEVAAVPQRRASPVFAIAAVTVAVLLVIVGVGWAVWPSGEQTEREQQAAAQQDQPPSKKVDEPLEPEPVAELVIEGEQPEAEPATRTRSGAGDDETGALEEPPLEAEAPTTAVWFESERNLGTCQITVGGRTRTANLHLKTRQVEGPLEFSYRCGEHRGRGSIDVKLNRVNGVLFCKKKGSVKVKTVRSNEGRCDR
jgi:hypothetical protein